MPQNPNIPQGSLNRLRPSLIFPNNTTLNVTASYLGKASMRLTIEGDATQYIGTLTGAVTSPEPYLLVSIRMALLKTQALANAYKAAMETNTFLGPCTLRSDAQALGPWQLHNSSIFSVPDLNFDGSEPDYPVVIKAVYQINSFLFSS